MTGGRHVGRHRETIESGRHVRGTGSFIADLQLPGMLHVAMVRSPHAHARIRSVDLSAAERVPGVHAVLSGADVHARTKPIFTLAAMHIPPLEIPLPALAHDKVRHVGEPVIAIAATSRAIAEDAAALVRVEYEPLQPLADAAQAMAPGAPRVHDAIPDNVALRRHYTFGDVDGAFARADRVVRRRVTWPRQTGAPLDTFGCAALWEPGTGQVTFWSNHQSHALAWTLGDTLGVPSHRIRAVPCDVGGAFGGKFWQPRAMVVCALLSRDTGRPVQYIEDRIENLEGADNHGENREYEAEIAVDRDGRMLALRLGIVEDYGSALLLGTVNNGEPLAQVVGPYGIEAVDVDFTAVLTTKPPQAAYRGLGTTAATFVLERLVDAVAQELGVSRIEIREKNLLRPQQFPYRTPTGNLYDSGDYPRALKEALELAGIDRWRERRAAARTEGRALGIGVATCQERSVQGGTALWLMYDQKPGRSTTAAETATVRIDARGQVRVALHSPSLGTPNETVAATVVGEELGVDPGDVLVTRLDTDVAGPALGPSASRMTVMLSGAVAGAVGELREAMRILAADLLGAPAPDLEWDTERVGFGLRDRPDDFVPLARIAAVANTQAMSLPKGVRSGLECTFTYDHPMATPPSPDGRDWGVFCPITGHTVHIPVVEVDLGTGQVEILDYAVVHDCGTVLNPDAVRGQIIGGICQGVGTALLEELRYRADGTPIARDLRSYLVPTTLDMPSVRLRHVTTPSPFTYKGVKGVGEGGRIAAPAAIISAIEDALSPWGVRIDEVPVTPEKILRWVAAAPRRGSRNPGPI